MSKFAHDEKRERDFEKEYLVKAAMLIKIHEQVTWSDRPQTRKSWPILKKARAQLKTLFDRILRAEIMGKLPDDLINFLLFVIDRGKKQVKICVIGKNPFSFPHAQEVFKIASRGPVRYCLTTSNQVKKQFCQIVFIAEDKANEVAEILEQLRGVPTLTISEIPGFARQGGCIEFFLFANRLTKLVINEQAALEKGLTYGPELYNKKSGHVILKKHWLDQSQQTH